MNLIKHLFLFGLVFFLFNLTPISIEKSYAADGDKAAQSFSPFGVESPASDLWRAVRQREGGEPNENLTGRSQVKGANASTLINVNGQEWRSWRTSKLIPYSIYAIVGTLLIIALFRLIRGKIKIKAGRSGKKIKRFSNFQRFVHWTVAISFVILGITGVILTLGRYGLLPIIGKEAFGFVAYYGKIIHNYLGPVFAVMLVVMLFTFIKGNMFNWTDIKWFLKGGGLLGGHASAGRYNGGEKAWYWAAMLVGLVVVASGLVLNFPEVVTTLNLNAQQYQWAQFLHAVGSIGLFAASFGHIYMGTIAMEGAFEAMKTGECDSNWAKEHHDLWYQDLDSQGLLSVAGAGVGMAAAGAGASMMSSGGSSEAAATMQRSSAATDSNVNTLDTSESSSASSQSSSPVSDVSNAGENKTPAKNESDTKASKASAKNDANAASGSNKKSVKSAADGKFDDLKKIEGIGPKIESILHDAGLTTYGSVKNSDRDAIKAILEAAGSRYRMHEPRTWPDQAALAEKGAWDELKELQDKLDGGR